MDQNKARELYYYKVPVFITDMIVHCLIFFLFVNILDDTTEFKTNGVIIGSVFLLAVSYTLAIVVWPLKLTERGISIARVILRAIIQSLATIIIFMLLIGVVYKIVPRTFIVEMMGVDLLCIITVHIIFAAFIRHLRKGGKGAIPVIFIGADHNNRSIYKDMEVGTGATGYVARGMFTSLYPDKVPDGLPNLGKISDALPYLVLHKKTVQEVFCSLSPSKPEELEFINPIIRFCEQNFIRFNYVPNMEGYPKHRMQLSKIGRTTVIRLHEEPLDNPLSHGIKRLFDIVVSGAFLLLVFWWLYIIVGLIIKKTSPGPIFFKQKRTGYNGKSFECLKFRSMKVSADADTKQATADDPRKTSFGDFMRRTSIDELPQFINVFKGEMSVIGPRPHMEHHTEIYSRLIGDYMVRHLVKPGITGWAQINGCRGETKTVKDMEDRVEHDIWYIEHWSMALDIEIFFRTIWQVLRGDKQAY